MAARAWFQLVRLANLPTAAADSLAGWLLAGGALGLASGWLPVAGASVAFYAGGVALNDLCDWDVDRRERPERPLPSGAVSRSAAARVIAGLLGLGLVLAAVSGRAALGVACGLLACVVLYDRWAKPHPLGPLVMGGCRGLNLLLGAAAAGGLGRPEIQLIALAVSGHIAGVTWVSRHENRAGRSPALVVGVVVEALALVGLAAAAGLLARDTAAPWPWLGWTALLAISLVIVSQNLRALSDPQPARIRAAVKTGILSLAWLHAAVLWLVCGVSGAIAMGGLWIAAVLLAQWMDMT